MKYSCLITAIVLAILLCVPSAYCETVSKEKKYAGHFPATKGDLTIDNRYGRLEINTWDRNEVTVDITVKVKASSAACAQEMLDRVRIEEPGESANGIRYRTIIESKACSSNMSELNIDYVINMPRRHTATFINKYGDVRIADVEGKIEIDLKYGKLTAGSFKGTDNNISVAYGSSTIPFIETGTVQSAYSKLSINKAGNIKVESKYEKTTIGTVRSLEIDQKYGDLDIGTVSVLKCNIQFANFSVEKLLKSVQLNLKYGSGARFEYVGPDVDNVSVNASYSNLSFHLDDNISLAGDVNISYGQVRNNVSAISLTSSGTDRTGNSTHFYLKAGGGKGRITVNGSYGNVTFQ